MRALFVTTSDLSGRSGNNLATKEMVAAFAHYEKFHTSVIAPRPQHELPEKVTGNVDQIWELPEQRSGSIFEHLKTQIVLLSLMFQVIRKVDPDVIVARKSPTLIVPAIYCWLLGIPYVYLARGVGHRTLRFSWLLELIYRVNVRIATDVYGAYEEVTRSADRYRTANQSPATLFPNAVDPALFKPYPLNESRSLVNVEFDEEYSVGFVGSLKGWHRLGDLIEAIGQLQDELSIEAMIVGEGPKRDELEQKVNELHLEDKVLFTGFVPHDEVPEYVGACDVLYGVVDPEAVGNPIKCYEYLACERPIITVNRPELSFVSEIDAGICLVEISPDTVANALHSLLALSPNERDQMGKRGREYVVAHHTWERLPELVLEDLTAA